jgi:LysR family cyn operon transcriptional activator
MRWSLRQVEIFLALVEEGGFSAAGERLRLAQPAVSIALRKLEDSLGVSLLDRSGQRVRLTREGTIFLRHARAITAEIGDTARELAKIRSLEAGQITIGAPPMVAGYLLPRIISAFLARHPGIKIKVVQGGANVIAGKVREGEIDLGFVADWHIADDLEIAMIENHPMVACVPARSPLARLKKLSWDALLSQPLILFPKGYHQRLRVDDAAARLGRTANIVIEAESVELIVAMVKDGRGVATLLESVARDIPGIFSISLPAEAVVPVALCRHGATMPSVAAASFYRSVTAWLRGDPKPFGRQPGGLRSRDRVTTGPGS